MISADQLVAHLVGDYVFQSDWMANEKTKSMAVALVHAAAYSLPFWPLSPSWAAMAVIVGTHAAIDRWRLARVVCWFKNLPAPARYRYPWSECLGTGYHESRPAWLAVWLLIIADNTMHIVINALALHYL